MKKIQAWFAAGVMVFLVLGIPAYVAFQIWGGVESLSLRFTITPFRNQIANTSVCLLALAVVACIVGATFKFRLFRSAFDWFTEKVPLVSTVAKFIPKNDELEILTDKSIKEVVIRISRDPEIWVRGLAIKTWMAGGRKWVRVYIASCPVPFTGYCPIELEWDDTVIKYTGHDAAHYSALVMSFGIRSDDHKKLAN